MPHDGRCPRSKKAQRRALAEVGSRIANSSVVVKSPAVPPLCVTIHLSFECWLTCRNFGFCRPQLRTPPPLTAEGKVVTPPPEKSFIQKYWMYFAIAFLAVGQSCTAPACVYASPPLD